MIRKAWAIYAGVLSVAVVLGEVGNLSGGGQVDARTLGNWVVTAVLLIAVWGYALQKPIGPQHYWRPAFWVLLVATLATMVPAALAGAAAMLVAALLLLLVVPAFVATYLYAYRSPQLWPAEERSP